MIHHHYKVCKSQWGIFIDFYGDTGEFLNDGSADENCTIITVSDNLHIIFKPKKQNGSQYVYMHPDDYSFIVKGILQVADLIVEHSPYQSTAVIFNECIYSVCDFQKEGLTVGAMEWAAKAFDFECPKVNVSFDKNRNQYIFDD